MVELVLLHASVALAVLHTSPHAPQLLVFVMSVSQPLATLLSQFAWPESHLIVHVDPTQLPVPPAWLHALPQPPQLFVSLVVLISQPLATLLSQFAYPALHATEHFEAAHVGVALFVLHAWPHPPQFFGSVVMVVSQPFAALLSQLAVPATLQVDTMHVEFVHTSLAPVAEHEWVHDPQLFVSFAVSISHPSAALLSQSA